MKKLISKWGLDTVIIGGAGAVALIVTQNPMIVLLACVGASYFSEAIAAWARSAFDL